MCIETCPRLEAESFLISASDVCFMKEKCVSMARTIKNQRRWHPPVAPFAFPTPNPAILQRHISLQNLSTSSHRSGSRLHSNVPTVLFLFDELNLRVGWAALEASKASGLPGGFLLLFALCLFLCLLLLVVWSRGHALLACVEACVAVSCEGS